MVAANTIRPVSQPWTILPHWKWKKMGDVATVVGGSTPPTDHDEYFGGDIPWITPADLSKYTDKTISNGARNITEAGLNNSGARLLPAGTVLFSSRAPIGYVAIAANPLSTNQGFKSFILAEELRPDFVYYYLQRARDLARSLASGTTFLEISGKKAAQIPIPVPPLDEQQRIVAQIEKHFTRLEAAEAALIQAQAALKRYRASILKAACDGPWPRTTVHDIAVEIRYGTSAKANRSSGGVPVLRMGNIFEGRLLTTDLKYLPVSHPEFPDLLLKPGDLLFNRTNSAELVGKTAVYNGTPSPCSFASYLIRVRLGHDYRPEFLSYYLNSPFGRQWIATVVTQQVGQANVNGTKLKLLQVPNPPPIEQRRLVARVERSLSVIEELESVVTSNLQRAVSLRQSILQHAFSGRFTATKSDRAKQLSPTAKRHFLRVLLSAEIVHRLHAEPTFGQTKHQKIFHLCEHIAQLNDLKVEYHREAAGPYDNRVIYSNAAELKRLKWYEEYPRQGIGHAYRPLAKAGAHAKYLGQYWPDKLKAINGLIELMRSWKTDRCEIFSTVYAAWNDLILWGRAPTDETILHEILNCWHPNKRAVEEKRWRAAIGWIRESGFAPTGFGKPTKKMQ
jgi:type I restriction enzyme, S subunit